MQERLNQIDRYLLCLAVFLSLMRELRPTEINFTYSELVFALLYVVVFGSFVAATGYGGMKYVTGAGRLASFGGNPNDFALMIALSAPAGRRRAWGSGAGSCRTASTCAKRSACHDRPHTRRALPAGSRRAA
jgi:hypothetical protein